MPVQVPSEGTLPPPSRAEALEATWREYYRHASEAPRHPAARDFLHHDLASALVKMYQDNAATLTPDPLYSAFYDSHPPAPVRIARLTKP